jgi:hypothetical protein
METRSGRSRTLVLVPAALLVFMVAWFTGRQAGVSTSNVTRVYDVRELLVAVPDFDNPPTIGLGGGFRTAAAPPPATSPSIEQRTADLISLIESYVDRGSWSAPGRAITVMGKGRLLVSHAPETHERVAAFLAELGAARGPTITVEAMIFSLDPAALDRLPPFAREILKSRVGRAALSEDEMRRFKGELAGAPSVSIVSAPRMTVLSGQRRRRRRRPR